MLLNFHISAYARCLAGKVCGLVRSTWGTSQGEDKPGARDKILNTKVAGHAPGARRANIPPVPPRLARNTHSVEQPLGPTVFLGAVHHQEMHQEILRCSFKRWLHLNTQERCCFHPWTVTVHTNSVTVSNPGVCGVSLGAVLEQEVVFACHVNFQGLLAPGWQSAGCL